MAEERARNAQYEYKALSNLVLQADWSLMERRARDDDTGEVRSLFGKLDSMKMGDRFKRTLPSELFGDKKTKVESGDDFYKTFGKGETFDVRTKLKSQLALGEDDMAGLSYRPRTAESKITYEFLLSFAQEYMGDQPRDILCGAVDEVLGILKNDGLKDMAEKKPQIEKIMDVMTDDKFAQLVGLGKKINDYQPIVSESSDAAHHENQMDDEMGVAVVFDDDEDDEDDDDENINQGRFAAFGNDVDQDISEPEDDTNDREISLRDGKGEFQKVSDQDEIDPRSIDAYWLQRKLNTYYQDPVESQKKSEEIISILMQSTDDRECENRLVLLLDYEKFDLIRIIRKNRLKVAFCTRLAMAQSKEERDSIEEELRDIGGETGERLLQEIKGNLSQSDIHSSFSSSGKNSETNRNTEQSASEAMDIDENKYNLTARKILDLDDISFTQGGHFMSNKKCQLPEGTFKKQFKGYEEIHVPPPASKPFLEGESLVRIEDMPSWAQPAFAGFKTLNRVQSRLYESTVHSDENILLCAPTGAGKTNVAMCCILRTIGKYILPDQDGVIDTASFKIVYIAPMKSLVQEMVGNFSNRLSKYGIKVGELTGDSQMSKEQISDTQIIVCTPEKWDIITRKSGERSFASLVKLIIIDEIHLLHDDRGPVLESIVSRTVRMIESTQEEVRLVGLSATLPNYRDVALFLRVDFNKGLFFFDNSYRPCPLRQEYIGISEKKALKRFQTMNEIVYQKVEERAGKCQVLVFVHSRKETVKTAKFIMDMLLERGTITNILKEDSASYEILRTEAENVKNCPELKHLLPYGLAIHHAGMSRVNRTNVEELFADGHIQVLVSTATLAWGVNLPAHTVIIKGTQIYSPEKGHWTELGALDVLQMLGRAGRPQYDKEGEGILITTASEMQYYLSLLNQQLPVESQMISKLPDNLNAEIVAGTVSTIRDAVEWLSYTFLFIRMVRVPTLYGILPEDIESDPELEQRRIDLVFSAAMIIDKAGLIKFDRRSGNLVCTELGRIASHYYVTHASMSVYNSMLKPSLSDIDLMRVFSLSSEFKYISVREEEKIELSKISQLKLDGLALVSDMVYVTQSAGRLARAIFEIALSRSWAQLTTKALNLCKMVDKRMWLSMSPLRQFKKLPSDIVKRLEKKDFPWERYFDLSFTELGELVRLPKLGKTLYNFVHQFPKLDLAAHVQPISRSTLRMEVSITPDFVWDPLVHGNSQAFWIFVEDGDNESILYHEYFLLKSRFSMDEHSVTLFVPLYDPLPPQYFVRVVSDRWLEAETSIPVPFKHLLLPEKSVPPTELLDLQPLPIHSCGLPKQFQQFYDHKISFFNPVQTQVFNALFSSDENVFLGASSANQRSICAEFAIFRALLGDVNSTCVYLSPKQQVLDAQLLIWKKTFEKLLGVKVTLLQGDSTKDVKELERAQIVLSTPENWDLISRRWKKRKSVQNVRLFIADDLHLLGSENGPVYEIVCSRMRFMSAQLETSSLRIVGLSVPVSHARDLANWLGVKGHSTFNFHPKVSPVQLQLHFQGLNIAHASSRLNAMIKPAYSYLTSGNARESTIIYVPSRKNITSIAFELLTLVAGDTTQAQKTMANSGFLLCALEDIQSTIDSVSNKTLRESLAYGIGLYHEGISPSDLAVVDGLFRARAIQCIVATRTSCWNLVSLAPASVIIMDTQYYDGKEHKYVDYPLVDLLQMVGQISPQQGSSSKVTGYGLVLCHESRKKFLSKFLMDPLPVESHLNHFLHDHFNAEIVSKIIETKQDAVDYLTWTYFYRRMTQNPNYYGLTGCTHRHLSEFMSELVEETLTDLERIKCISIEGDDADELSPLNLGMIGAHYSISHRTLELLGASLTSSTKIKNMLRILSEAVEFENLIVRHKEDTILQQLDKRLPFRLESDTSAMMEEDHATSRAAASGNIFLSAAAKVNILLQCYFSRILLNPELQLDLDESILKRMPNLLQACVDVLSSQGWLTPALYAMELSQMCVQALWVPTDSVMKQIPHFSKDIIQLCEAKGVSTIFDFMELEDGDRMQLMASFSEPKIRDVARFCNRYPNIDLEYHLLDKDEILTGNDVRLRVRLQRDDEDEEDSVVGPVIAPFFPISKDEGWWLVVGDNQQQPRQLISIKRIPSVGKKLDVELRFKCPKLPDDAEEGSRVYHLYLMCDSYVGCDQEYEVKMHVRRGEESSSGSGEESDDAHQ